MSGTIAGTGPGVTRWTPGQRVVLYAGEIREGVTYTRGVDYDGGWAEYALSSEHALTELPAAIPFDQARSSRTRSPRPGARSPSRAP